MALSSEMTHFCVSVFAEASLVYCAVAAIVTALGQTAHEVAVVTLEAVDR